MKKYNQDGKLNSEVIQSIMEEEKPNQKEKPAFRDERITKLIRPVLRILDAINLNFPDMQYITSYARADSITPLG